MVYENDNIANELEGIFIEPPYPSVDTDEDSGDEIDNLMINNLTGRQLQGGAQLKLSNNERIGTNDDDDVSPQPPPSPAGPSQEPLKSETNWIQNRLQEVQKQKLLKGEQNKWVKGDLEQVSLEFPSADYSSYEDMTCI